DNNPTLAIDGENRLWLFHSTMLGAPKWSWGSSIVQYKISSDYLGKQPRWEKTGLLIPMPTGFDSVLDDMERRVKSEPKEQSAARLATPLAMVARIRVWENEPIRLRLGWMPRVHPLLRSDGAVVVPLSNENFEIPMMAIT